MSNIEGLRKGVSTASCIGLVGKSQSGKTKLIMEAFNLSFTTDQGETIHPFRPLLFVSIGGDRTSAGGTASEMLTHEDCDHVTAETVDDTLALLEKHGNDPKYNAIVVDSLSSFRRIAVSEVRQRLITQREDGRDLRGQAKKNMVNNDQQLHGLANGDVLDFINKFSSIAADRPILKMWTCHTKDKFAHKKNLNDADIYLGQAPEASFTQWTAIHAASQIIWHLHRELPDPSYGMSIEQINEMLANKKLKNKYYAYTAPMPWPGVGLLEHVKRQSDGHMASFDTAPGCWEDPSLGDALSYYLELQHGLTFNDDKHIITD